MLDMSGYWYLDSIDTFIAFNMMIHHGATTFLQLPPTKPSNAHDWPDRDGIDTDLSRVFYTQREITLECSIITSTEAEFLEKRDLLMNQFKKPDLRRLQFKSTGQRSFYVYLKDSNGWQAVDALKGSPMEGQVMYKFNLVLIEPDPTLGGNMNVYIAADDGKFLMA